MLFAALMLPAGDSTRSESLWTQSTEVNHAIADVTGEDGAVAAPNGCEPRMCAQATETERAT